MPDLISQPFFLFGLVVFVAGVGAVAVKAFGVELGAVTPNRSFAFAAVGLVIMAGGWWAAEQNKFEVTALDIKWESAATLRCDSVQAYVGAIETTGDPRPITYRVIAGSNVLVEETFTPSGAGRTPISGQARVRGSGLPDLGEQGLGIYLEILAPDSLSSNASNLGSLPGCGALFAEPITN